MDPVAEKVLEHWKKYRPKMYAQLEKEGVLEERVKQAAELYTDSLADLLGSGPEYSRALELIPPIAYLPDEEDVPELPENPNLRLPATTA